ncbi:MAG: flagellar biosynthetic protein FliO [Lachnospiraceae bacterium]|nr:flagellar biosynthetic protein FliO [Lachnospiraceae bacterium]
MLSAVLTSGSMESAAQFLTVLLIFLAVLALTYFTTRFIGKYQKMQIYNRNFEAVETYRVADGKFLQIVRVGRRYFVIAIGKNDVSLVSEISEEDIDLSAENSVTNDRFKQLFESAKDKITKRGDKQ